MSSLLGVIHGRGSPYRVPNTPDGDANTRLNREAALGDLSVVIGVVALDIKLSDGNLGNTGIGESLDGGGQLGPATSVDVTLRADAVDGDTGGDPLLDVSNHAVGQLGVVGVVKVVVVDVQLCIRVGLACSLEGDPDKVLSEDLREDGLAQGTVLVEHLVDNILRGVSMSPRGSHKN